MPPENVLTKSLRRSHSSNIRSRASHRSRRACRGTWYSTPWMSVFSHAVVSPSRLGSWNTTPNRLRTSVGCAVGSSPSSSSEPLVGRSRLVSILMVVVLPAPFGPRNAKISPARTSNETSLTALTSPNDLTMCWTRMMGRSLTTLEHHGLNGVRPRSDLDRGPADGEVIRSALCRGVHDDHDHLPVVVDEARREQHAAARRRQDPAGDRKSTRLNSSHQIISYAVFCL